MSREQLPGRVAFALAGIALFVVAVSALVAYQSGVFQFGPSDDPVAYSVGDRIDVPSHLYESTEFTAVLFARASCAVCQRMRAFYADVVAELNTFPSVQVLMVSGTTNREDDLAYASELGLRQTQFISLDSAGLRVRQVPSLILVNRHGTVLQSWEGAPTAAERATFSTAFKSVLSR